MGVLKDRLSSDDFRSTIVMDCVNLVDSEVNSKKGVTGMVIKGGYKAFKALKPGIVKLAVEHLLDDFVGVVEPHYEAYLAADPDKKSSFETFANSRATMIANDMLGITDAMLAGAKSRALAKIYKSMRKVAERNVAEAVPGMARVVQKNIG